MKMLLNLYYMMFMVVGYECTVKIFNDTDNNVSRKKGLFELMLTHTKTIDNISRYYNNDE